MALLALAVLGCRGSPSPKPAPALSASVSPPAASFADAAQAFDCPADLVDARQGGAAAGSYQTPSEGERALARAAFASLVRGEAADVAAFGFERRQVREWPGVTLLREQPDRRRGGGVYLVRAHATSTLVVQAPHTFYDEETLPLACDLFERTQARALFINTAHRYRGAPETRGEHPSDVAHAPDSFFLAMTEGMLAALRPVDVVQLHGFHEGEGTARVVLSAGDRRPAPPFVRSARAALEPVVGAGVVAYPDDTSELGATTNVEGMLVRRAGGRFLHVEMDRALRAQLATDDAFRLRVFQVLTQSFR